MNLFKFFFKATECNGWPKIKILVNGVEREDMIIERSLAIVLSVDSNSTQTIEIVRYGKAQNNTLLRGSEIVKDQLLELESISVDDVKLPDWYIHEHVSNSHIIGSNVTWKFTVEQPIVTYILDQKINHEAKYNSDYLYPWSHKLGPNSVKELTDDFSKAIDVINSKL